jgi:hypothetical protein
MMATYSSKDFEQIAAAMGIEVRHVCRHAKQFEAAAMWYRLGQNALKNQRPAPFVMRRRMTQIANAARNCLDTSGLGNWPKRQMVPASPCCKFSHQQMMEPRTQLCEQPHE